MATWIRSRPHSLLQERGTKKWVKFTTLMKCRFKLIFYFILLHHNNGGKKQTNREVEMIEIETESLIETLLGCLVLSPLESKHWRCWSGDLLVESPQSVYSIFGCIMRLEESYQHVIFNGDEDKLEQHRLLLTPTLLWKQPWRCCHPFTFQSFSSFAPFFQKCSNTSTEIKQTSAVTHSRAGEAKCRML